MKKAGFIILLFSIIFSDINAQDINIKGVISGISYDDVYLLQSFARGQKVVDTTQTDISGNFIFYMKPDWTKGMYRVLTNSGISIDFIYSGKSFSFSAGRYGNSSGISFKNSMENKIFHHFNMVKNQNEKKLKLLKPVVQYFPRNDSFYSVAFKKVNSVQQQTNTLARELITSYPQTIAAHFIKMENPVIINLSLTNDEQNILLKKKYFDHVDFGDTLLLRTGLFTKKIVGYLALFQQQGMTKKEAENAFIAPVDTLLKKASVNEKIYSFILSYLLNGFKQMGFSKLVLHIAKNNILGKFPGTNSEKFLLQHELNLIVKLAVGKQAPDFTTKTLNGKKIHLYDVKADTTLLVFWASWCPHCTESLPKLKKFYNPSNTNHLQIIAISVDDNKKPVEKAIHDEGYLWPNIAELNGWESSIPVLYGINATPSYFLLDKNKRIIAKPANIEELENILKKNNK